MRYHELISEKKLPDPREFGVVTHGPELYLHYTHTPAQLHSILQGGFDLKKFGLTAKKFNMRELAVHDPRGVFATEFADRERFADRPWLVFKLEPTPNVLTKPGKHPGWAEDLKTLLATTYGVSGSKLSQILLKADIQVLHSTGEFIILDPSRIKVVRSSLDPS